MKNKEEVFLFIDKIKYDKFGIYGSTLQECVSHEFNLSFADSKKIIEEYFKNPRPILLNE